MRLSSSVSSDERGQKEKYDPEYVHTRASQRHQNMRDSQEYPLDHGILDEEVAGWHVSIVSFCCVPLCLHLVIIVVFIIITVTI